jgi:hypothetical protein
VKGEGKEAFSWLAGVEGVMSFTEKRDGEIRRRRKGKP